MSSNATVLGVQQAPAAGSASAVLGALMFAGGVLVTPLMALGGEGTAAADGGGGRRWCDRGAAGDRAPYTTTVTVSAEDFGPIVAQVREFVRDAVVPREREIADTNAVPDDLRAQAAEMGLFGYALPEEYGGLGLDLTQDVELALELGYTTPAFRSLFGTNNGIAGQVLVGFGTEEQKKRWLPRLAAGEVVALVRAHRGRGRVRPVRAAHAPRRRDGDGWVINGSKRYITNAPIADLFVVVRPHATQDGRPARHLRFPRARGHARGHGRARRTTRWARPARGPPTSPSTTSASPRDALVSGEGGRGYAPRMTVLARGRLHIAALCVGLAQRVLDESVAYAATVRQGGAPIGELQLVQAMLADQQAAVLAGRRWSARRRRATTSGSDRRIAPSATKLFCSEMVGPGRRPGGAGARRHGYMRETPVERLYRDVAAVPALRGHQRDPAADRRRASC